MSCPSTAVKFSSPNRSKSNTFIRWILNDAVLPQTGMGECPKNSDGLCPLDTYISALKKRNGEIDFDFSCFAIFNATIGQVTNGQPPSK